MMNILMMMAAMLLFIQLRGTESYETREARLAHMKDHNAEVRDDEVDQHVVDADDVHGHAFIASSGEGS